MSWWKRLWHGRVPPSDPRLQLVCLDMPGWNDEGVRGDMRGWRDGQGNFISLVLMDDLIGLPKLSNERELQDCCRQIAKSQGAGLIEVRVLTGKLGPTATLIYKRLLKPAYQFTGMLFVPNKSPSQVWTVVAKESSITGVREATITAELMNAGSLTLQDYERSWAQDPYDAGYRGVDRSVLRFVSDDESYDERFPEHPLSKVRQILAALPNSLQVESGADGSVNC